MTEHNQEHDCDCGMDHEGSKKLALAILDACEASGLDMVDVAVTLLTTTNTLVRLVTDGVAGAFITGNIGRAADVQARATWTTTGKEGEKEL